MQWGASPLVRFYLLLGLGSKPGSAVPYSFSIIKLLANAIWDSHFGQPAVEAFTRGIGAQ